MENKTCRRSQKIFIIVFLFTLLLSVKSAFAYDDCDPYDPQVPCNCLSSFTCDGVMGSETYTSFYDSSHVTFDTTSNLPYYSILNVDNQWGETWVKISNSWGLLNGNGLYSSADFDSSAEGFFWIGAGAPIDTTIFNNSVYSLSVISPTLNENYHADVQPSENFKIKLRYSMAEDRYDTTRINAFQCASVDPTLQDCTLTHSDTVQDIRDNLPNTSNFIGSGYVYFEIPVVLDEYTIMIFTISDETTQSTILTTQASFKGVNDASLPSADTAIIDSGQVQDLGFWGNMFRELFVPSSGFTEKMVTDFNDTFHEQFGDFFTFWDSMHNISAATYDSHLSGNVSFEGHSFGMTVSPFENIPSYVPTTISYILYLGLGFFLIRNLSNIFPE